MSNRYPPGRPRERGSLALPPSTPHNIWRGVPVAQINLRTHRPRCSGTVEDYRGLTFDVRDRALRNVGLLGLPPGYVSSQSHRLAVDQTDTNRLGGPGNHAARRPY